METIWLSPTDYVTGDPTLRISYPSVSHPGTIVTCTAPGDLKWISMGLRLPEYVRIEEIIICYQVSSARSFISQVRLVEMSTPEHALVLHDDGTNLHSTSPVCYRSTVAGKVPTPGTAVTLSLRLTFHNPTDQILLGAVGVKVQPLATCVTTMAELRAFSAGVVPCLTVLGYYTPGDGGGGRFYWDAAATEVDNGGTIIVPNAKPTAGRWKRLVEGPLSVKWFGAKGDGITDDSSAIQRAVNVGPHIVFPPGTYICKHIYLPSSTTVEGLGQVTLKRPDGQSSAILISKWDPATGSIGRGSTLLEVDKPSVFHVGAVCTVLGAAGGFSTQETKLTSDIGDSGTILEVDSTAGFNESEGMLLIEAEFVKYCGKTDTSFCVFERGALGSTRCSHSAGTSIQFAKPVVTTVTGISGNRITLKDPATFTVLDAPVEVGAVHLAIRNLHFDGNKVTGPHQNQVCLALAWARFFRIEQCVFQNGDHGGIVVRISQDGWITDNYMSDNGQPTMHTGANLWLFANCRNIRVTRNIIGGGSMIGIAIDDRTSQAFPWQGPCEDNLIESNLIAGKGANNLAVGILVDGASRNLVTNNHILDCVTGIKLSESQVSPVSEVCKDNVVCFNILNGCLTGISGSGSANLICNNKVIEATTIILPRSNPHYNNGLLTNFGIGTPKIEIGLDTNLYRSAANVLKTDNQFQAVDGLATKTKEGAISDADFAAPPPDGTVAVDMSASRLYIRIGGTWKSVGLT